MQPRIYSQAKPNIRANNSFKKNNRHLNKSETLNKSNKINEVKTARKLDKQEQQQIDPSTMNILRLQLLAYMMNQLRATQAPVESETKETTTD